MNFDVGLLLFQEASTFFWLPFSSVYKTYILVTIGTKEGGFCCRLEIFFESRVECLVFVFNQTLPGLIRKPRNGY